jgi:hypothetical protein
MNGFMEKIKRDSDERMEKLRIRCNITEEKEEGDDDDDDDDEVDDEDNDEKEDG